MRARPAGAGLERVAAVGGVVHAERVEEALLHLVRIEIAGGSEHQVADQAEGDVLVAVALPRFADRSDTVELGHQQRIGFVGFKLAIVGVVRQPGAMAEDVLHRRASAAALQVAQLECRQVVGHARVPAQRAVLHQHGAEGAGERLGE
jgi:hypothetical protein